MSLNEIVKSIKKYNNFLITAHVNPEGDALGSQLGFYNLIKKLGKRATIVSDDQLPGGYDFLPGIWRIRRLTRKLKHIEFDCLVVLDCADLKRTGRVYQLNQEHRRILNIDHHISNQFFGDVNWVDAQTSSCSEMIYKLYKQLALPLDQDTALVLYTGIMTDTGSFRYANTSSATFKAVAELLKFKVKVAEEYRQIYENIPAGEIKVLLKFLSEIKFFEHGRIVAFELKQKVSKKDKNNLDLADYLLSFGRAIKGVEVVVLLKQSFDSGTGVRVNLRSQGRVDVNKIATFFGGGGHKAAAGCTITGSLSMVRSKVIAKICQGLK